MPDSNHGQIRLQSLGMVIDMNLETNFTQIPTIVQEVCNNEANVKTFIIKPKSGAE